VKIRLAGKKGQADPPSSNLFVFPRLVDSRTHPMTCDQSPRIAPADDAPDRLVRALIRQGIILW
jgi:hypothetical protein